MMHKQSWLLKTIFGFVLVSEVWSFMEHKRCACHQCSSVPEGVTRCQCCVYFLHGKRSDPSVPLINPAVMEEQHDNTRVPAALPWTYTDSKDSVDLVPGSDANQNVLSSAPEVPDYVFIKSGHSSSPNAFNLITILEEIKKMVENNLLRNILDSTYSKQRRKL